MTDESKKPWYTRVPALAAAGVAFLVALTTLVKNVSDMWTEKSAPATPTPAAAPAKPEPAVAPPQAPKKTAVTLTLQKIEVLDDGSNGTTTWSFAVEAGGQSLFELAPRDYSDSEAEREVTPRSSDPSMARVVLVPGQEMLIKVTGRSPGVIGKAVIASGSAMLTADGPLAPIRVQAEGGRAGTFVFHFATAASAQ